MISERLRKGFRVVQEVCGRAAKEIGIMRKGRDIVDTYSIICRDGERHRIKHQATAAGICQRAVMAARWISSAPPEYTK